MPKHEQLVQGQVDVADRPDGGCNIVWADEAGNVTIIGLAPEARPVIGNKILGRQIEVANGHVPRTDDSPLAPHLRRPQG